MMTCRDVIEHLWDYLDGELSTDQTQAVAAHLAECARCYPQYRFQYAFLELLVRNRERISPPPRETVERLRRLIKT